MNEIAIHETVKRLESKIDEVRNDLKTLLTKTDPINGIERTVNSTSEVVEEIAGDSRRKNDAEWKTFADERGIKNIMSIKSIANYAYRLAGYDFPSGRSLTVEQFGRFIEAHPAFLEYTNLPFTKVSDKKPRIGLTMLNYLVKDLPHGRESLESFVDSYRTGVEKYVGDPAVALRHVFDDESLEKIHTRYSFAASLVVLAFQRHRLDESYVFKHDHKALEVLAATVRFKGWTKDALPPLDDA